MDPITIGTAVGAMVVAQLTGKLLEKAVDPENVAKSVNWIFTAVGHFLSIQKGEKSKEDALPPPPTPSIDKPIRVEDEDIEAKTENVMAVVESLKKAVETPISNGIYLIELDEFATKQLTNEVRNLMELLEKYLDNLHELELEAALYGGPAVAPLINKNLTNLQQQEIVKCLQRLNRTMKRIYGVDAPNLDTLAEVTKS